MPSAQGVLQLLPGPGSLSVLGVLAVLAPQEGGPLLSKHVPLLLAGRAGLGCQGHSRGVLIQAQGIPIPIPIPTPKGFPLPIPIRIRIPILIPIPICSLVKTYRDRAKQMEMFWYLVMVWPTFGSFWAIPEPIWTFFLLPGTACGSVYTVPGPTTSLIVNVAHF